MTHRRICAYCGEEIHPLEGALWVTGTDDLIHEGCWTYYAEENISKLTTDAEPYFGEEAEDDIRERELDLLSRSGY